VCEGEKKGSRRVESSGVIWESKEDKLGSWTTLAGLSMRQSGDDQQWRVCSVIEPLCGVLEGAALHNHHR
jgi:hypothetical protein